MTQDDVPKMFLSGTFKIFPQFYSLLANFQETVGKLQTHLKKTGKPGKFWMCLQFLHSLLKICRKGVKWWENFECATQEHFWHIVLGHLQFYSWEHHSHTTRKITKIFWMSHSGTSQLLSLGKFMMFPIFSQLGHPGHMTWGIVNVTAISLTKFWMSHSGKLQLLLWKNSRCSQDVTDWKTSVAPHGTLWMYWSFSRAGTLQENWLGKSWMNLRCAEWEKCKYFVHFLVICFSSPY